MKGYKGFEKGMICRGKQYKEHTVFEEEEAVICEKGMHFCKNPFDVLDYYDLVDSNGDFNDFAEAESLEEPKTNDNKKYCTTKLKIGAKLSFGRFVETCVDYVIKKTKTQSNGKRRIGSSGYSAQIGSSGNFAQIGSSGDSAQIGSSGYSAQIGSSGDSARIGSSGDSARIGSSGYSARIGSSGDFARIVSSGENCVICCAGNGSAVKAKKGSWITLAEWDYSERLQRHVPVCVRTEYVDGEQIKGDTFYILKNGQFEEVETE